jgi:hypothetical protein
MKIFVSYTLRDGILNPHILREVELVLAKMGTPYIDVLHNRSYYPQAHVVKMLNQASVLFACLTPEILKSNWVQFELMVARTRGIPILAFDPIDKSWLSHDRVASLTTHSTGSAIARLSSAKLECLFRLVPPGQFQC